MIVKNASNMLITAPNIGLDIASFVRRSAITHDDHIPFEFIEIFDILSQHYNIYSIRKKETPDDMLTWVKQHFSAPAPMPCYGKLLVLPADTVGAVLEELAAPILYYEMPTLDVSIHSKIIFHSNARLMVSRLNDYFSLARIPLQNVPLKKQPPKKLPRHRFGDIFDEL